MDIAWEAVAIAGWAVLLVNLLVTLRLARWLRTYHDAGRLDNIRQERPELSPGEPAPAFQARDLGGAIVKSGDFSARETAFVFVHPQCGMCRRELPGLVTLAALAGQSAGTEIVLVSGGGAGDTQSWLESIRQDDGIDITLRVLVAGARTSDFQATYNPRGLTPYFCQVDQTGTVTARGGLHTPAWASLIRKWDPATASARNPRLYR